MITDLAARARAFASERHAGQVRKYTGEPYIVHVEGVVQLVASAPHTEQMLAGAWLHDVVEDTDTTLDEIEAEFGTDVASYVRMLTKASHANDGLRRHREAIDRAHLAQACPAAKTIKLADIIENGASIATRAPRFARVYLMEKRSQLEVLMEGDPVLYAQARNVVEHGLATLNAGEGEA